MNYKEREVSESEVNYLLSPTDYIDKAFKRIPNGIIDKGRCGIGGTTLELKDSRHSIIVVPNISIIKNKQKEFPDILDVYGETSEAKIVDYIIANRTKKLKIMSTPESLNKIINASILSGFNIYDECFILADEAHSVITEGSYRNMWTSYDLFFKFKNKATISATPLTFSDDRFRLMARHVIRFTEPLQNEINLILTKSIEHSFASLIKSKRGSDNNLHVFYNTVEGIALLIDLIGSENVSVFCADNSKNRETLGVYEKLLKDLNTEDYSVNKINFYTTKYFEGWDLIDEKAEIILLSDVYRSNTLIGINTKGIQAIGRLRSSDPKAIYHITSLKNEDEVEMRRYEDIKNNRMELAKDYVFAYNELSHALNRINLTGKAYNDFFSSISDTVNVYGDIDYTNSTAKINYFKVDSSINNDIAIEQYLNKKTIEQSWRTSGFSLSIDEDQSALSKKEKDILKSNRVSKTEKNKLIYEKFNQCIPKREANTGAIFFGSDETKKLIKEYPEAYNIYNILGYDEIKKLGFNIMLLREELIRRQANKVEASSDLFKLMNLKFKSFTFYPSEEIKRTLIDIYKSLNINKNITSVHINKFFNAEQMSKKILGKTVRGFYLRNKLFR